MRGGAALAVLLTIALLAVTGLYARVATSVTERGTVSAAQPAGLQMREGSADQDRRLLDEEAQGPSSVRLRRPDQAPARPNRAVVAPALARPAAPPEQAGPSPAPVARPAARTCALLQVFRC
ncbi:hypothetical protein [Actinomadura macrotermitis]|uniref:hypothetical protein n=1 Tax=Actinomadura macrotermitis TaxID=2585200 RepID=UPI001294A076|nr:hypothetical protein [Actinomadura macrotermitis]